MLRQIRLPHQMAQSGSAGNEGRVAVAALESHGGATIEGAALLARIVGHGVTIPVIAHHHARAIHPRAGQEVRDRLSPLL